MILLVPFSNVSNVIRFLELNDGLCPINKSTLRLLPIDVTANDRCELVNRTIKVGPIMMQSSKTDHL